MSSPTNLSHKDWFRHQLLQRITNKEVKFIIIIVRLRCRFEQLLHSQRVNVWRGPVPDGLCELPVNIFRRMVWIPPHMHIGVAAMLTSWYRMNSSAASFTGSGSTARVVSTHVTWNESFQKENYWFQNRQRWIIPHTDFSGPSQLFWASANWEMRKDQSAKPLYNCNMANWSSAQEII